MKELTEDLQAVAHDMHTFIVDLENHFHKIPEHLRLAAKAARDKYAELEDEEIEPEETKPESSPTGSATGTEGTSGTGGTGGAGSPTGEPGTGAAPGSAGSASSPQA